MTLETFSDFALNWGLGISCLVAAVVYLAYRNKVLRDDKADLQERVEQLHNEKALLVASIDKSKR